MNDFEVMLKDLSFTECPRWHDGRLFFTDRYTHRVLALNMDGTTETYARIEGLPAGIGFLPDGRLLIVSMRDRILLRHEHDGSLVLHADLSRLAAGDLNDMLVDSEGCAWVGNFGFDLFGGAPVRSTDLLLVEPDGSTSVAARDLWFPNGMALTPDGRTLVVAETMANRLTAFTLSNRKLTTRRVWAAFGPQPSAADVGTIFNQSAVVPDGICMDAAGAIWVADVQGRCVIRVQEGGRILDRRSTNDLCAFACMLGGEDGPLFVCAAPTFAEAEAAAHHRACILMTKIAAPRYL